MKIEKIKNILKVNSLFQLIIVLLVFSITGSLSVFASEFVLNFLGIDINRFNLFIYWFLRVLILFTVYQFLLIFVGTLMGQFKYFWNFEKRILKRLGLNLK